MFRWFGVIVVFVCVVVWFLGFGVIGFFFSWSI